MPASIHTHTYIHTHIHAHTHTHPHPYFMDPLSFQWQLEYEIGQRKLDCDIQCHPSSEHSQISQSLTIQGINYYQKTRMKL